MREATITEVCDRMLENLERDGWCQRSYHEPAGQECLTQAARTAIGQLLLNEHVPTLALLQSVQWALVRNIGGNHLADLIEWNDADGREFHQIRELLKTTADQHR